MRHAVLAAPKTIEWRDAPSPRLAAGEVLVDVRAALTCGTDLKTYRRGHPKLAFGPFGHEASGDIVAVGDGVTRFAAGDAVMWAPTAPCGSCVRCTNGTENLCLHLFDGIALGAYGKQIVLPPRVVATNVYRKPESLTYIEAAFLEPLAAVVHGWNVLLRADAASRTPRSVAIVGSGTIGMLHLLNAVRAGSSVTMISSTGPRAQLARD
ncbi:MAG TPA: alcohol dehydrogenase catalytic domain-containing protein, partial [Candidatus Eremiobacteraceae bacterium]|nr:alcohol dehydrogenase catalytic domain-containing protein [Candidatus Eremiobacteraceae bacterium]